MARDKLQIDYAGKIIGIIGRQKWQAKCWHKFSVVLVTQNYN